MQALTSLGLSWPMTKGAARGLRREMRPNADFLTVTSIVASLLLGNANSALMILALSDLAELMTSYTIERTRSSIKKMLSVEDDERLESAARRPRGALPDSTGSGRATRWTYTPAKSWP
ncbi:MAG: hypothetical protein V8Q67_06985 [Blautia massiliensis (ex Durand et al. 2017)]